MIIGCGCRHHFSAYYRSSARRHFIDGYYRLSGIWALPTLRVVFMISQGLSISASMTSWSVEWPGRWSSLSSCIGFIFFLTVLSLKQDNCFLKTVSWHDLVNRYYRIDAKSCSFPNRRPGSTVNEAWDQAITSADEEFCSLTVIPQILPEKGTRTQMQSNIKLDPSGRPGGGPAQPPAEQLPSSCHPGSTANGETLVRLEWLSIVSRADKMTWAISL